MWFGISAVENRRSLVLLREKENPLWNPLWSPQCGNASLRVFGILLGGALMGGEGVPGCTERVCVCVDIFIYF